MAEQRSIEPGLWTRFCCVLLGHYYCGWKPWPQPCERCGRPKPYDKGEHDDPL